MSKFDRVVYIKREHLGNTEYGVYAAIGEKLYFRWVMDSERRLSKISARSETLDSRIKRNNFAQVKRCEVIKYLRTQGRVLPKPDEWATPP